MSSVTEKICIDCKMSKPSSNFANKNKMCNPCFYIRRTKGKNKMCKICEKNKPISSFVPKSNLCKECVEKEQSENCLTCDKCKVFKSTEHFSKGSRICFQCGWLQKASAKTKTCRVCKEIKPVLDFTKIKDLCKKCKEKEEIENTKTCSKCDISKTLENFEVGRYVCKECRSAQKNGAKTKTCKICKESKVLIKFLKAQDVCKECANTEKFENSRFCKTCEEIKPYQDFYGASCVCKSCSLDKGKEKMKETRNCENCNEDKELKLFRFLSTTVCLECEDKTITKLCRDCNTLKSISDFRPKRSQCNECEKIEGRNYRRTSNTAKKWVEKNPDKMSQLQKKYYEENKKEIRKTEQIRRIEDKGFGEVRKYKPQIPAIIRGLQKTSNKLCTNRENYLLWLRYNFRDGMTLENYSSVWCVDHVIPLCLLYDVCSLPCKDVIKRNENSQKLIYSWYNTTPLLKLENRKKTNSIDKSFLKLHMDSLRNYFKQNKNIKKDDLFFQYKKFVIDILEFLYY